MPLIARAHLNSPIMQTRPAHATGKHISTHERSELESAFHGSSGWLSGGKLAFCQSVLKGGLAAIFLSSTTVFLSAGS